MADFKPIFKDHILVNEGGYAMVLHDKGAETAYGISRRYNPNWPGWVEIDRLKNYTTLKTGQHIPSVEVMVEKFYLDLWTKHGFGEIKSQAVAAIYFDFFVNSGYTAVRSLQSLARVPVDGIMGPRTVAAINSRNPDELFKEILEERYQHYLMAVGRDPRQQKFWGGWIARLKRFEEKENNIA